MKDVLISIRPKWVEKIVDGIKKGELRKGWFNDCEGKKFFIYCTNGTFDITACSDLNADSVKRVNASRGKVIGEFICDKIDRYTAEFVTDFYCYEDIRRVWVDDDGEEDFYVETGNFVIDPSDCDLCRLSCLTYDEIKAYIGESFHDKKFCLLHISNLKIYDTPKELSEFGLKRPPQNYCYVEVGK